MTVELTADSDVRQLARLGLDSLPQEKRSDHPIRCGKSKGDSPVTCCVLRYSGWLTVRTSQENMFSKPCDIAVRRLPHRCSCISERGPKQFEEPVQCLHRITAFSDHYEQSFQLMSQRTIFQEMFL